MKDGKSSRTCLLCGQPGSYISGFLGVCAECIKVGSEARPLVTKAHERARESQGLPGRPPRTEGGSACGICSNRCVMGENERGYCGLRWNGRGLKSRVSPDEGLLYSYLDPHVTNCCSAWFCPGGTGAGYPRYSTRPGPELGYYNLSAFLYGCNFDCLFCQNPSHKDFSGVPETRVEDFVKRITSNPRITCICYFGGSPEPQMPFALNASKTALEQIGDRPLRICFEMNGCGERSLAMRAAELALESGGNLKFDLKCFTPSLSLALSGVENRRAYENFEGIAEKYYPERPGLPLLTATTLMVPGYVDASEVESIARFIADLDPTIPYGLLAFHPAHLMRDLPPTPIEQALECYRAARKHLERVNVGNLFLLGIRSLSQFSKLAGEW